MEPTTQSLVVAGRYKADKQLVAAKHGILFAARDLVTQASCILKVYRTAQEIPAYQDIEEELAMARRARDVPNSLLVNVLEVLEENGRWFAVFEPIEGLSLYDLISRHPSFLRKEEISRYFLKVLDGIISIKTEEGIFPLLQLNARNIILTSDAVRVMDFELQLLYDNPAATYQNKHFLSESEIITQLGAILYTLLCREEPQGSIENWKYPKDFNPMVYEHFVDVLKKCIDPRPTIRFLSLERTREVFLNEPPPPPPPEPASVEKMPPLPRGITARPRKKINWKKNILFAIGVLLFLFLTKEFIFPPGSALHLNQKLLCAATGAGIEWLNPDTGKKVASLPIPGTFPTMIPWPQAGKLILAESSSNVVISVDPNLPQDSSLLLSDMTPRAYAFDPILHQMFVSDGTTPQVYVVSPEVADQITMPIPQPAGQLIVDESGQKLYAASAIDAKVMVLDLLSGKPQNTLDFPEIPDLVYASRDALYVYLKDAQIFEALSPSGEKIFSIPYHFTPPVHLEPIGDGTSMVVWSEDPKLALLETHPVPTLMQEFRLDFVPAQAAYDPSTHKIYFGDSKGNLYALTPNISSTPAFLGHLDGLTALALWIP